jgi:hypothetical protein
LASYHKLFSLSSAALVAHRHYGLLERSFVVYDALFARARQAADERHTRPARDTEKAA